MALRGPVLACVALDTLGPTVLSQAQSIAAGIDASLIVAHVLPESFWVRVLFPQDAGPDQAELNRLETAATAAVSRLVAETLGESTKVALELATGSPHAGVLSIKERRSVRLIVVGPGRTAHRLARSSACPVLVARASPMNGPVIGATDFSDPALPALAAAVGEARRRRAQPVLAHCLNLSLAMAVPPVPGTIPMAPLSPQTIDRLKSWATEKLTAAQQRLEPAADVELVLESPAAGIVNLASQRQASLVVVGTHGRTGLARLALGSVAESVMDRAPCSVLIVPLDGEGQPDAMPR